MIGSDKWKHCASFRYSDILMKLALAKGFDARDVDESETKAVGEKAEFRSYFPLFVLVIEPMKRHPVSDTKVVDAETTFAIVDIWGEPFLQAFTSHRLLSEFLKTDDNEKRYNSVLCPQPIFLRRLIVMLRDFQLLKVGVLFDPRTPELRHRMTYSEVMGVT
jgi:hypothetical protein